MRSITIALVCIASLIIGLSCGSKEDPKEEEVIVEEKITPVPAALGYSSFYKKYLNAAGIPIVSSEKVTDAALFQAQKTVKVLLEKIPAAAIQQLITYKVRVAVMAETEKTTDIPEHSDLNDVWPDTNWDTRARGLGATKERPATSCAEENILCYTSDRYRGEDILVHEFSHSIHQLGLAMANPAFDKELKDIYEKAKSKGLWANTYAISNYSEYWAEAVQSWFNVNQEAIPANGVHNHVNTREELKGYDPEIYELVSRYFSATAKDFSCHE